MTAMLAPTGLLTAADLSFEPDDGLRRELHDGVVYVVPLPSDDHQWVESVVDRALYAHAPDDVYVLRNVGIHTGIRRMYVPDVTVVRRGMPHHDNAYDPTGILVAVEIVSPSSTTMDRITKPAVYAEVGIPYFWRVEPGPRLVCHRLGTEGVYAVVAEAGRGEVVRLDDPWPVEVRVDDLVMPHKR
jgi:Uma2 family endonuclease